MNLTDLKLIFRSFRKDKLFFGINLLGMAAGILVTLLTGYYVYYKLSYDKFIKDHDQVYRIDYIFSSSTNHQRYSKCSESLAYLMQEKVPGIKEVLCLLKGPLTLQLECDEQQIDLDKNILVNHQFLDYYKIDIIDSYKNKDELNSSDLLITESFARKYFGSEDPLGKELRFSKNNQVRFTISGIIRDLPANSHIVADVISFHSEKNQVVNDTDYYSAENLALFYKNIFLVLEENTSIDDILTAYKKIKKDYMQDYLDENGYDLELTAVNISDIHYCTDIDHNFNTFPTENLKSVYYFLVLSILVILVSIINFINLSLARYKERHKEIGIKRTLGDQPGSIFSTFFIESTIQVLLSLAIGFIAFKIILSDFAQFMGISLQNVVFSNEIYLLLTVFLFLVVVFSSLLPALSTARKKPVDILRSRSNYGSYKGRPIFFVQVILTYVILTLMLIMILQMNYINKKEKGYDIDDVIAYEFSNWGPDQPESFEICQRLKKSAYIEEVAVTTRLPGQDLPAHSLTLEFKGNSHRVDFSYFNIDTNYIPFMGINLLAGENYHNEFIPDTTNIIVNEAFINGITTPDSALDAIAYFSPELMAYKKYEVKILGVTDNFHVQTLHNQIGPVVLYNSRSAPNYFLIRYSKENFKEVVEYSDKVFDQLSGASIFSSTKHFPAEELLQKYEAELHLQQITLWLSLLSIFLTIFGLFSITAYNVKKDLKSLCIRKIFGAGLTDLFKYMIRLYAVALITANIIAVFLAWYIGNKWLERFAYRIELSFWIFIPGIFVSFLILFISVSYHVFSLDKTDPADVLQYE